MTRQLLVPVLLCLGLPAVADDASPPPTIIEHVEVTATKLPAAVDEVPALVTVVAAADLRARGATDLSTALALVAGVDVVPGGDGGPASSVPEFWGLREFDAFLLLVDGIPWGGAFNPDLSTVSLADVDRIEVHRGPAPAAYGATSFVGVVNVIRRSPGAAIPASASLAGGSYGSGAVSASSGLPSWAGFSSRIGLDLETRGFSDDRTSYDRAALSWRNRRGSPQTREWRLDLEAAGLDQEPGSPHPREGPSLSAAVPIDANHNPSDAFLDPRRLALTGGHAAPLVGGTWTTVATLTTRTEESLRGFLDGVSTGPDNAIGIRQAVDQDDVYVDTRWSRDFPGLTVVAGADWLNGKASLDGGTFRYTVNLDGSGSPAARGVPLDEAASIEDTRNFGGLYGEAAWHPAPRWRIDAGLRLNVTSESRDTSEGSDHRSATRGSGNLGATWTAWARDEGHVRVFGAYENTFKPAAIDLGIDADPEILEPETSEGFEAGVKARTASGRCGLSVGAFSMQLDNLVVAQDVAGIPGLVNAGSQTFEGVDLEGDARLGSALLLRLGYGHHDARFQDYVQDFDGVPTQLEGKRLEMSPRDLASAGLVWTPAHGFTAHLEARYLGQRWLNKRNTASAESVTTWSAGVGWRGRAWEARLDGVNLGDERPPVAESELADASYYLLPARSLRVTVHRTFGGA